MVEINFIGVSYHSYRSTKLETKRHKLKNILFLVSISFKIRTVFVNFFIIIRQVNILTTQRCRFEPRLERFMYELLKGACFIFFAMTARFFLIFFFTLCNRPRRPLNRKVVLCDE